MDNFFEANLLRAILLIIASIAFYLVFVNTIKKIVNKESYKYDLILNSTILALIVYLVLVLFAR